MPMAMGHRQAGFLLFNLGWDARWGTDACFGDYWATNKESGPVPKPVGCAGKSLTRVVLLGNRLQRVVLLGNRLQRVGRPSASQFSSDSPSASAISAD